MEHRRLIRESNRLKALLPLFEISKSLMSEVELGRLFDAILEIVRRETEADSVSLMLLDDTGQELVVKAALGDSERMNLGRERVGEGLAGWVAMTAQPLMLTEETPAEHPLRQAMTRLGASSLLCIPLVAKGRVIGVLRSSKWKGSPFTDSDLELLTILCGQAAIAIENAMLLSGARTQQRLVDRLLKQTLVAEEHERQRISLEIHDSAAQWMVAASYRIGALARLLAKGELPQCRLQLSEIKRVIDQSIKELRRVIFDLQPPPLAELGLVGALHQYVKDFAQNSGIAFCFKVKGTPTALSPLHEITLYRATQEALANVRKHAHATKVDVCLSFGAEELCLVIRDNGKGFDATQVLNNARSAGGLGLQGMKDRAEALAGTMRIEAQRGAGTTLALTLPLCAPVPRELSPIARMLNR